MIDPAELEHEHIFEVNALVGEYSFRIKEAQGVHISVRIYQTDVAYGGDRYTYTISHHVHAPGQADPYYPSATFGPDEQSTLELAIRHTLFFYTAAVNAGHKPSSSWFIEDEDF
jgi:hypothetical protein